MQTRIYIIREDGRQDRLVEAANPAQALRYAAGQRFTANPASASTVARLMGSGVKVEQATGELNPDLAEA